MLLGLLLMYPHILRNYYSLLQFTAADNHFYLILNTSRQKCLSIYNMFLFSVKFAVKTYQIE